MPKKKTSALSISNISKKLDKKIILNDISLEVGVWEIFGFLGPNGAGKTTTMKCILGLISLDAGEISVLGGKISDSEIRKKIWFMPENTYLYTYLTGEEFLAFNAKCCGISKEEYKKRIPEILTEVGLEHAGKKFLKKYSKGMLQRIGLGQAIIHKPKIVFLDEPMSGLDPLGRRLIKNLILHLKKEGVTVFFNTHVLSDVESVCDRFSILHDGKLIVVQKVSELKKPLEEFFVEMIQKNTKNLIIH